MSNQHASHDISVRDDSSNLCSFSPFAWLYLKLWVKLGAFGPVPNDVWRLQGSAGTRRSVCSSADCIPVESCDDALNCPGMRPLVTRSEFTLLKATFAAAHSVGFKHRFYTR